LIAPNLGISFLALYTSVRGVETLNSSESLGGWVVTCVPPIATLGPRYKRQNFCASKLQPTRPRSSSIGPFFNQIGHTLMLNSSQMSIFHKSHDSVATLKSSFLGPFARFHVRTWPSDKWPKAGLTKPVAAALVILWLSLRSMGPRK
jgi:hypothetical protein